MSNSVDSDYIAQEQSGLGLHLFARVYLFKHLGKKLLFVIKYICKYSISHQSLSTSFYLFHLILPP